jgi:hypothetical protein
MAIAGLLIGGGLASPPVRWAAILGASGLLGLSGREPGAPFRGLRPLGVGVVTPLVTFAFGQFLHRSRRWEPALYAAVTLVGVWATVPDTETVLVVAGAALPGLALTIAWPEGTASALAGFVGLVIWAAADGARGRPTSFIAALGCFGLLAVSPASEWARRKLGIDVPQLPVRTATAIRFATHASVIFVCARVAGPLTSQSEVALVTLSALAAGAVVMWAVPSPPQRAGLQIEESP